MWLKLGEQELINLDHVSSIKKGEDDVLIIQFHGKEERRILPFPRTVDREAAFERIVRTLVRIGKAIE